MTIPAHFTCARACVRAWVHARAHVCVCVCWRRECAPAIKTVVRRIKLKNYVYIINQSLITRLQLTCYVTQYTYFTQAFISYWTDRSDMYVTFLNGYRLRYITPHYNTKSWITMYTAYLTGMLSLHYLLYVAWREGRGSLRQTKTIRESGRWEQSLITFWNSKSITI